MPRSSAGANFYVEQMLLTPLAKIGHALIALSRTPSTFSSGIAFRSGEKVQ
jgi:hypothetical protein